MRAYPTTLHGVLEVHPDLRSDGRGGFFEAWHATRYRELGMPAEFRQCNVSVSKRGVLRGLHFQHPNSQAKLITAVHGTIFDVAVDVRRGSPSFGQWHGIELDAKKGRQLFIPGGLAHGFLALTESVVMYLATALYDPSSEIVVRWDDPTLGIAWPSVPEELSGRDAAAPLLSTLGDRLPNFEG